ncbi:MAG: hypothetical protein ACI9TK_000986 [Flavobacteriaceae bacterium]|jgi:hypothetical protein|tara:strand:- start:10228 stop:10359 length:132 start_codon:yes stop_codon:yes gene_type:complete
MVTKTKYNKLSGFLGSNTPLRNNPKAVDVFLIITSKEEVNQNR